MRGRTGKFSTCLNIAGHLKVGLSFMWEYSLRQLQSCRVSTPRLLSTGGVEHVRQIDFTRTPIRRRQRQGAHRRCHDPPFSQPHDRPPARRAREARSLRPFRRTLTGSAILPAREELRRQEKGPYRKIRAFSFSPIFLQGLPPSRSHAYNQGIPQFPHCPQ